MQIQSAEKWRDYPHIKRVARGLLKKGFHVYSFDKSKPLNVRGITNIIGKGLREVMIHIKKMNLMIGPDSGLLHIAGALGVPILGIIAPTDPLIRYQDYDNSNLLPT